MDIRPLLLLSAMAAATAASAVPVTYTISSTTSGVFNEIAYTDALVTFTLTADTDNLISEDYEPYGFLPGSDAQSVMGTGSVTVAGVGSGTFLQAVDIYAADLHTEYYELHGLGFSLMFSSVMSFDDEQFANYDLSVTNAPIAGFAQTNNDVYYDTTFGRFNITVPAGPTTFSSVVGTQAVPEPASMAALGLGGLALLRRRRKSA